MIEYFTNLMIFCYDFSTFVMIFQAPCTGSLKWQKAGRFEIAPRTFFSLLLRAIQSVLMAYHMVLMLIVLLPNALNPEFISFIGDGENEGKFIS